LNRKLLALTFGLLLASFAHAQVANIKASSNTGCAYASGSTIIFDGSSAGATSWSWTFGDVTNNTAATSNPNHTYFSAGTYTVTLIINGGSTATTTITIYPLPVVDFTVDQTTGCFPLNVNFTDKSTPGSGSPTGGALVKWLWDFGDGVLDSSSRNPAHRYDQKNTVGFPVTLKVTDANGCFNAKLKPQYIIIPDGVTPNFTTIASQGCKIPITVNLNNTSTGPSGSTLTYTWNFGDGSATSTVTSPSHTYTAGGNYNIKLIAVSSKGCSDSLTVATPIIAGNVTSNFSAPDSICVNSVINFQNTSAPAPTVSSWDFGDGTTSNLISPSKTFTTANVYKVKLVNTFGACIDSISKQITVLTPAVANFTATNILTCDSVFTVSFTDQSTGASSRLWNFGDGKTSTAQNPTHTYTGYGSYSVTLQASNATGCSGSITKTNYIQSGKPYIEISKLSSNGCAPFSFTPVLIDTVLDGIKTYSWDFGDGTTSTAATPSAHSYNNAGTYYVKLTITTNGGCSATTTDTVKVGTIKPVADFTASPTTVCVGKPVTFTDKSTNNPDQWLWTFDDGNSTGNENTTHTYLTPGTYTVTLRAYNNGCNDSVKKTILVNLPLAKFDYTFSCSNNKTQFDFHDSSQGADTWNWDFGDGNTSTAQNPTHIYANADSTYTVFLTVANNSTGCTHTYAKPVFIVHDTGVVFTSFNKMCINTGIYITPYKINASQVSTYTYYYGDGKVGGPANAPNSINYHVYDSAGTFTINIVLKEKSGCLDTLVPTTIQVDGPTAQFISSGYIGCTGLSATFTDQSKSDGISPITKWIWDFGDSTPVQTLTGPPFSHNYNKQGIYTVKLKVVDASGCYDSIAKVNLITVAFPSALIGAVDSLSCPGSPIQFQNNSKGYGLTYTWDFGDGSPTSNATNPSHIYPLGTYNVSLKVVDQYGCTANSSAYNVHVDVPTASFTVDNTFASCPPLTANFKFTGSYVKTFKWDFGDGGLANIADPSHLYNSPGTYTASLVVISHGGCTATAPSQTITILGPNGTFDYSPLQGCHNLKVDFSITSSDDIVKYFWIYDTYQSDSSTASNISFTYDSIGSWTPYAILENSAGCNVKVLGKNPILITGSVPKIGYDKNLLCDKGTVQFADSTKVLVGNVTSYKWDFGDGNTSTLQNPSHFYASPGLYTVKFYITVESNCADSVVMTNLIKVVASPSIAITGDAEKCVPASMNFQGVILVADTSAFKWHWDFGNGNTDSVQNPVSQIYTIPGTDSVKLTATNSSGCATTVAKAIKIDSIAQTNAGPDTAICVGQSASLHASSTASPAIYTWLPPNTGTLSCTTCSNPIATPSVTTTYYVQATNSFGCGTIDSVTVIVVQPATMNVSPLEDSICLGQKVQLIATGEQVYTWSPAAGLSNPSIGNPFASPDTTTIYQVTGSDSLFCFKNTQSVKVSVFKYPTVNIGPSPVTIPIGTSYQFSGTGSADIDSINWSPSLGLSCTDCLSPIASPVTTTTYTIKVENNGGCITTDSVKIIVTCDGKNLFVPNTFSPNGDGVNDWFFLQGKGLSTIQSMRVFNRWGQLVFEKKNFSPNVESEGWDGNFNGKKAPVDVYIYTIEVICQNSQIVGYNGNVALIR